MNSRHLRTLEDIFRTPPAKSIDWDDVRSLLVSEVDCTYRPAAKGSGRKFIKGQNRLQLHEPHPDKTLKRYAVDLVREFLVTLGVTP